MNPITNAQSRFSGRLRSSGQDGARPSANVAVTEGYNDKRTKWRIRWCTAFTLIEILIVIGIILFLAGLLLAISGFVQEKGKRSRAEAEIAAMSAALESYKADNGIYPGVSIAPNPPNATTSLDPTLTSPASYVAASQYLYVQLSGDSDDNPTTSSLADTKNYFGSALKPNMLNPNPPGANTYIHDPFGNSYGYSTARASNPNGTVGYNPTYDLWSTGGSITPDKSKWIKNW